MLLMFGTYIIFEEMKVVLVVRRMISNKLCNGHIPRLSSITQRDNRL